MRPTGNRDLAVAGVRYKAWQPASGMHPVLPVNAPLTFEIIDTRSKRSLGGCIYHARHSGRVEHDALPGHAGGADARHMDRFRDIGPRPWPVEIPVDEISAEFPTTLDLRRTR
jgi:uncharacterized protein (DUF2126 family)